MQTDKKILISAATTCERLQGRKPISFFNPRIRVSISSDLKLTTTLPLTTSSWLRHADNKLSTHSKTLTYFHNASKPADIIKKARPPTQRLLKKWRARRCACKSRKVPRTTAQYRFECRSYFWVPNRDDSVSTQCRRTIRNSAFIPYALIRANIRCYKVYEKRAFRHVYELAGGPPWKLGVGNT